MDIAQTKALAEKRLKILKKGNLPQELLQLVEQTYLQQLDAQEQAQIIIDESLVSSPDQQIQGHPLILRDNFPFDAAQAEDLFEKFLQNLLKMSVHLAQAGKIIEQEKQAGRLELPACQQAFLQGNNDFFVEFGQKTPQSPQILQFLTQSSMTPSIEVAAAQVNAKRDPEHVWQHAHCPVCGSLPLISSLREKEGFRFMTCSFCHTDYRFMRISCPFCLEKDFEKLKIFSLEELPGYRADVCTSCKMYIKTADFRKLDKKYLPVIDDLESLPLDVAASREGYTRPTLSAWGF